MTVSLTKICQHDLIEITAFGSSVRRWMCSRCTAKFSSVDLTHEE